MIRNILKKTFLPFAIELSIMMLRFLKTPAAVNYIQLLLIMRFKLSKSNIVAWIYFRWFKSVF